MDEILDATEEVNAGTAEAQPLVSEIRGHHLAYGAEPVLKEVSFEVKKGGRLRWSARAVPVDDLDALLARFYDIQEGESLGMATISAHLTFLVPSTDGLVTQNPAFSMHL